MLSFLSLDLNPQIANYEGALMALLVVLAVACTTLAIMLFREPRKKREALDVQE